MTVYKVVTRFYDNGKVDANMERIESKTLPESTSEECGKYDEYADFFKTKKEAENWIRDAYNA